MDIQLNDIRNYLKEIVDQSTLINELIKDDSLLIDRINNISNESKQSLNNYYKDRDGIIIDIRKFIASIIISRKVTLQEVKNIEQQQRALKPESFRATKKLFSILFPFVTVEHKEIKKFLEAFVPKLIDDLGLKEDAEWTYFDFNGPRQQGSNRLWFAIYNKTQPDQSASKQIFFNFEDGEFSYGLYEHKTKQNKNRITVTDFTDFNYEELIQNLSSAVTEIKEDVRNEDTQIIDLSGHKLFKISHGAFKTSAGTEALEKFKQNNWIVIHEVTGRNKDGSVANIFKNNIKIGDYVYITIGGDYLYNIAKVISEDWEYVPNEVADEEGWIFREVEYIKEPTNRDLSDLRSYNTKTYPSYQSTVAEIDNSDLLETMNRALFQPHYNVRFINHTSGSPITNNLPLITHNMDLNTILYGPPGTGKTYNTIERAVEIASPTFQFPANRHSTEGRNAIKKEFESLQSKGKVTLTTFHQSLSYEDFIEGIKPDLDSENEELGYILKPGIFKKCCALASYSCYLKSKEIQTVTTDYDFDNLYDTFIDHLQTQLDGGKFPEFQTKQGKMVEVKKINKNDSIIARAKDSRSKSSAPLTKENFQKLYDKFDSIDKITSLQQVKDTVQIQPRTTEFYALFKGLKEFEKSFKPEGFVETEIEKTIHLTEADIIKKFESGVFNDAVEKFGSTAEPLVLIIDEINRGNVSAVFGELITLIESDKRWGEPEQLKLTLPYSQQEFFVPNNLYIVGTMNTADRSVEALDTALRRRFVFEPVMPQPQLLQVTEDGIELDKLLTAINERLSILKDKDHVIGHAWLWYVKNVDELKKVFENKILPLLQEYFFNDYEKMGLVLGDGFFNAPLQVKHGIFASFKSKSGLSQQYNNYYQYTLKPISNLDKEAFFSIYTKPSTEPDDNE